MEASIDPQEITLNNEILRFLIDESSEARSNPEIFKDLINEKKIQNYIEAFQTKRKDSNEYKTAVSFIKNYFDDKNKKRIDL